MSGRRYLCRSIASCIGLIARAIQKWVVDQHLFDFLRQLQRGQLQQLNGLLQLRREREMLRNA